MHQKPYLARPGVTGLVPGFQSPSWVRTCDSRETLNLEDFSADGVDLDGKMHGKLPPNLFHLDDIEVLIPFQVSTAPRSYLT